MIVLSIILVTWTEFSWIETRSNTYWSINDSNNWFNNWCWNYAGYSIIWRFYSCNSWLKLWKKMKKSVHLYYITWWTLIDILWPYEYLLSISVFDYVLMIYLEKNHYTTYWSYLFHLYMLFILFHYFINWVLPILSFYYELDIWLLFFLLLLFTYLFTYSLKHVNN